MIEDREEAASIANGLYDAIRVGIITPANIDGDGLSDLVCMLRTESDMAHERARRILKEDFASVAHRSALRLHLRYALDEIDAGHRLANIADKLAEVCKP